MTATGVKMVDVTLPTEQSEGTETVVSVWFKAIGDGVTENEPLLEVSTDKVNVEIASPASGTLAEIIKKDGDKVEPGELVGRIALEDASPSAKAAATAAPAEPTSSPQADGASRTPPLGTAQVADTQSGSADVSADLSPAVRRLLKEYNLDPAIIIGTGKGGRVTHQDVMNLIASGAADAGRDAASKDDSLMPGGPATAAAGAPTPTRRGGPAIPSRSVPHSQMRRTIAQHMVQSVARAPHVTSIFDADLSAIVAHRDANKDEFVSRGAKLTYTAYFVAASVDALKAVPEANSRWHDDRLEIFEDYNIGVATALPNGGLIVPVITKAQDLDLFGIAQRLQDLTERARGGSLDPKDVQGGTFTISNHGVSGSLVASPIVINQPQSAILGVGKMERRVVPAGGQGNDVIVKPMCYVTLTIDHRVLDGYQANVFLTKWVERIEGKW